MERGYAIRLVCLGGHLPLCRVASVAAEVEDWGDHPSWSYRLANTRFVFPCDNRSLSVSHMVLGCFTYLAKYPELMLDKWAKKYGPLFSFTIGNQLFVAISDAHIVKDLVITNGATFSSRKDMFMKAQLVFARRGVTATQYNDTWCIPLRALTPQPAKSLTTSVSLCLTGGSTVASRRCS